MKKLITAALATGLLLTGGMIYAAPASATASSSAPSYTKKDNLFYSLVTSEEPSLKYAGKKLLIKSAKTQCRALRAGVDPFDLYEIAIDNGISEDEFIALLAGALTFYCPDQEYKIL